MKARPVTGVERYAEVEAAAVRPFVYRRYLDYGVFESLREMKALIEREVERRELADHVKLGPGGIREIEFIVQALQLTRGGRDRRLQTPSLFLPLERLGEARLLPPPAVAELRTAYLYLRRLENRLQMLSDTQTHQLPADASARERVARAMGCADWPALLLQLQEQRATVSRHFRLVIFGGAAADPAAVRIDLGRFWIRRRKLQRWRPRSRGRSDSVGRRACCSGCAPRHWCASSMSRGASACRRCCRCCWRRSAGQRQLPVLRRVLAIIEAIGQRSAAALLQEKARRGAARGLCRPGTSPVRSPRTHPPR